MAWTSLCIIKYNVHIANKKLQEVQKWNSLSALNKTKEGQLRLEESTFTIQVSLQKN